MKLSESTQLKIGLMWEHIGKVEPEKERSNLRANMMHTFEKLLNFLDVDFEKLEKKVRYLEGKTLQATLDKLEKSDYLGESDPATEDKVG